MIKNTIILSDCLDFLKSLPNDSVDMVLTDPPYFIGFDGGKGWDSSWNNEEEYLAWCKEWTQEAVRVLKPAGMMIVWGTLKTDTFLKYKLNILNSFSELYPQQEIIWSYNWGGRTKNNFARKYEIAWCYSKGDTFIFNADDVRVPRKLAKNIRTGEAYTKGTIPTSIWQFNNHTNSKDFISWHPTTKNLDVLTRMIKAYTIEGAVILDCFLGSGSTVIAANRVNRNVIGCEKDEQYYSLILERLENERKHTRGAKDPH